MKIIHLAGSPRKKSNSIKIAETFINTAESNGATASTYRLNSMNVKGCQGCYACKKGKTRCSVKDDLSPVLNDIFEADLLLISTPVYFWDLPGQLKCFIDRTYSFAKDDWQTNPRPSRLPEGKHLVFIQTQAADESIHDDIFPKYEAIFKMFSGFAEAHLIKAGNVLGSDSIEDRPEVLQQAEQLATKIITAS